MAAPDGPAHAPTEEALAAGMPQGDGSRYFASIMSREFVMNCGANARTRGLLFQLETFRIAECGRLVTGLSLISRLAFTVSWITLS